MKEQYNQYNITFPNNPEYDARFEFTLKKSGAFRYGNGTCVVIKRNGIIYDTIDTRYEYISDFRAWCDKYIECKFNEDLHPIVEPII